MTVYNNKSNCTGCAVCADICTVHAIQMKADSEGFYYPEVDNAKCEKCGRCKAVCQINNSPENNREDELFYAAKASDASVARLSSSGGMFTLISDYVLSLGGCVFGVVWNSELCAVHTKAENAEQRDAMRCSKYVQSCTGNVYGNVADELGKGRYVLFTGTPCQCTGLSNYLTLCCVSDAKLFICDNICHGAPSPGVFRSHINYINSVTGKKTVFYNFRPKHKKGWGKDKNLTVFDDGSAEDGSAASQAFMKLFLSHYIIRPSCSACMYSFPEAAHVSDVTLGDFWGIQYIRPEMYDKNGVSAVIIRTEKGRLLWNAILDKVISADVNKSELFWDNHKTPAKAPSDRAAFYEDYIVNGYKSAIRKYAEVSVGAILKNRIKDLLRPMVSMVRRRKYYKVAEKLHYENRNNYTDGG